MVCESGRAKVPRSAMAGDVQRTRAPLLRRTQRHGIRAWFQARHSSPPARWRPPPPRPLSLGLCLYIQHPRREARYRAKLSSYAFLYLGDMTKVGYFNFRSLWRHTVALHISAPEPPLLSPSLRDITRAPFEGARQHESRLSPRLQRQTASLLCCTRDGAPTRQERDAPQYRGGDSLAHDQYRRACAGPDSATDRGARPVRPRSAPTAAS